MTEFAGGQQSLFGDSQVREAPSFYLDVKSAFELATWLDGIAEQACTVAIKRLSANDTGATGSHQAGVYLPAEVFRVALPSLDAAATLNPEVFLPTRIESHGLPEQVLRVIYYNNFREGGTRNEKRITRWREGVGDTPIQSPESTGAIAILAFIQPVRSKDAIALGVWVCRGPEEEDFVERVFGAIEPGGTLIGPPSQLFGGGLLGAHGAGEIGDLPPAWSSAFPSGEELLGFVVAGHPAIGGDVDVRLMKRRDAEFKVFCAVEQMHVLPGLRNGFQSVDAFVRVANEVTNRRKSRSGRSLELHLRHIFDEAGLAGCYSEQCVTEGKKRADFIFPSCARYHDFSFSEGALNMLAVKTTCKDRWRQILNEADRIHSPYLLTIQEGVSEDQFREMEEYGVRLVVPKPLHKRYPPSVRGRLTSLGDFVGRMKAAYVG